MNVQGFTGCPCEIIIEYIRKADAVSAASVDESVVPMTLSLNNEAEVLPMSEGEDKPTALEATPLIAEDEVIENE